MGPVTRSSSRVVAKVAKSKAGIDKPLKANNNPGIEKRPKKTRKVKVGNSKNDQDVKKRLESDPGASTTKPSGSKSFWLMKAEPESRIVKGKDVKFRQNIKYSIDDLADMENQTSPWDGVRNYEARNIMRDRMKIGDEVLFYHSNCKQPGIAGLCEVVRDAYPDFTAFDKDHPYYDPKSDEKAPRWFVDVKFVRKFPQLILLSRLKEHLKNSKSADSSPLKNMALLNRGRLSVQPVSKEEMEFIMKLSSGDATL
ncbi:hypothetical protein H4219_000902 [Mycoemilia scoparia]|uniref:Thymocyte nuclear protein 1 n=1 Tax=Mycoemilia scoparia TaxID=417184 RepID=A0A9W8DWR4_9FUNG|nr:hypothetical protein H4219_000902 [Mycoemilia scoparia]